MTDLHECVFLVMGRRTVDTSIMSGPICAFRDLAAAQEYVSRVEEGKEYPKGVSGWFGVEIGVLELK